MCGFFVNFSMTTSGLIPDAVLNRVKQSLIPRGPDDQSFSLIKGDHTVVQMLHTRLSLLDLEERSNQPFFSNSRNIILFNGEIYNHRELRDELTRQGIELKTSSDTEVLLEGYDKYGVPFFNKLDGMFSFVIIDFMQNLIVTARDYFGEKPLHIFKKKNQLIISSTIKAIDLSQSFRLEINKKVLGDLLSLGYIPGEDTFLKLVKRIKPGVVQQYRYSSLELVSEISLKPEYTQSNDLETALTKSIDRRITADVPVGVLLSGGIDSSLVTALASKKYTNINTYTVAFEDQAIDERKYAEEISKFFGTNHNVVESTSLDFSKLLNIVDAFGEPLGDSSLVPTFLLAEAVKQKQKAVLGGDGGDELFGGYAHYRKNLKRSTYVKYFKKVLNSQFFQGARVSVTQNRNIFFETMKDLSNNVIPSGTRFFSEKDLKDLFQISPESRTRFYSEAITLKNMQIIDVRNYLPNNILIKTDRASMANSVEFRSPFLTPEIMGISFSSSDAYHQNMNVSKPLIKQIATKYFPKNYEYNRKQGFKIDILSLLSSEDFRDRGLNFFRNEIACNLSQSVFDRLNQHQLFLLLSIDRFLEARSK